MKFVDSANGNFQLQPTSPALNAGTPDTTGLMLPLTDLAGNPRIFGDTIDMGAYEVQSLIPLPVHILAFTGSLVNEVARLQWLSGVEENLDYYELEMSVDGKKYVPLHSTSAKGNNFQYNYDFTQLADKAFYRLRSVDKNGQSAYLDKIIFLSKEAGAGNILIYPNPARKYIMVKTQAPDILTIYNAVGKQVARKALTEGINRINIENLSAGVYYGVMGHHKFQILKK